MIACGEMGVLEEKGDHGRNFRQFDVHVRPACRNRPRKIRCVLSSCAIDVRKVDSREMLCSQE